MRRRACGNAPNSIPFPTAGVCRSSRVKKTGQIVPASSDPALISPTHRVERAAGEFRRGVPVLIRPPAGGLSLTAAAETVGDQTMRLMAAAAGRGSLMITHDRAATLKIPLYTEGVISIPLAGDVTAEFVRAIADPAGQDRA